MRFESKEEHLKYRDAILRGALNYPLEGRWLL